MALDHSPESFSTQNEFYLLCSKSSNLWPLGRGLFDPRGNIWKNMIKVHYKMLHAKYQSSRPSSFRDEEFWIWSILVLCSKLCAPWARASFDPRSIIWTNLVEIHNEILYTNYESSRPSSLKEEEFWILPSLLICSNLWPPGPGQSWPQEHHMNKLGRGSQGDAAYQLSSNLYPFKFKRRRILNFAFFASMFQLATNPPPHPTPPWGGGQFWPLGHHMNKLGRSPQEDAITKYQSSRPSSFKEKEFWNFLSWFLCSNFWPLGRGQFWHKGHQINKLSTGPLEDATYQPFTP